jgi:hypothetical protein
VERPGKGPLVGSLFESLVTVSVRVYAQAAEAVDMLVVTTGPRVYRRPDGIAVVPLALLGP